MTLPIDLNQARPVARQYFGKGKLAGTLPDAIVTVAGAAARRRVVVLDRHTRKIVAQTWSAEDGSWRVDYLTTAKQFTVIAFDHENQFNAVIRDNITPATA